MYNVMVALRGYQIEYYSEHILASMALSKSSWIRWVLYVI